MNPFKTPEPEALAQSQTLENVIRREIQKQNGRLSFARFMELALYAPSLGYYSAGSQKIGVSGDFVTAPEISPLFAQCIARQCLQLAEHLGTYDILEFGAGSGKLAADLLLSLEKLDALPAQYFILEVSADFRERQEKTLKEACPHLFSRIHWLDRLLGFEIQGMILANEVMDALPVNLFHYERKSIQEVFVEEQSQGLAPCLRAAQAEILALTEPLVRDFHLPEPYQSEIHLVLRAWIHSLADILKKGLILLFDYGYGRPEYYHPERQSGTLICHYQHQRHANPFCLIGLQDITAHVDFTTVAETALEAGLKLSGFTNQAAFLMSTGILDEPKSLTEIERFQRNQAIKRLSLPAEMGEIVKVMALSRDLESPLMAFQLQDRRRDL